MRSLFRWLRQHTCTHCVPVRGCVCEKCGARLVPRISQREANVLHWKAELAEEERRHGPREPIRVVVGHRLQDAADNSMLLWGDYVGRKVDPDRPLAVKPPIRGH